MRLMKTLTRSLIIAALLSCLPNGTQAADYSKDPVLMVHGYFLGDFLTWVSIKGKLIDDGWPEEYLFEVDFANIVGCNPEHGMEISAKVQEILAATGRQKVDLLAHSMGAIDCRFYIKFLCGYKYVNDVVMIAGANRGTTVACIEPISCGADSMCVGFGDGDWKDNPFLLNLNSCDMTPGDDIKYTSIWSGWDEIIIPAKNSEIEGALNIKMGAWGVGHAGILLNNESYNYARIGLDGGGTNNNVPEGPGPCITVCQDPVVEPNPDSDPVVEPSPEIVEQIEPYEIIEQSDLTETSDLAMPDITPPDLGSPDSTPKDTAETDSDSPKDTSAPGDQTADNHNPDKDSILHDGTPSDGAPQKDGVENPDGTTAQDALAGDLGPDSGSTSGESSPRSGSCSADPQSPPHTSVLTLLLVLGWAMARRFRKV